MGRRRVPLSDKIQELSDQGYITVSPDGWDRVREVTDLLLAERAKLGEAPAGGSTKDGSATPSE